MVKVEKTIEKYLQLFADINSKFEAQAITAEQLKTLDAGLTTAFNAEIADLNKKA